MHILIIDDDKDFRKLVWWSFSTNMPEIKVSELDSTVHKKPPADFEWSRFDMVLLDHGVGANGDGLEWLRVIRDGTSAPPTLILTDDEFAGTAAMELGASGYLKKSGINAQRLVEGVRGVLDGGRRSLQLPISAISAGKLTGANKRRAPRLQPVSLPHPIRGYTVRGLIGQGGTSKVYLAERQLDGRTEVLKVIDIKDVDDGSLLERFVQEAELISRIRSPQIVEIYRQGFTDHYAFLSMELLSAGNLKQCIAAGMSQAEALSCLRQIAYALNAIHSAGIVHRDLKPGNLMFRDEHTLVLADFGIAKRLSSTATLTNIGQVIGTPYYMSPEQARGKRVDGRSDFYSVGAIFYEMLTGRRPFSGKTPLEMIEQHIHAEIPVMPDSLRQFTPLVNKLLAKDPDHRFQNSTEILDGIDALT